MSTYDDSSLFLYPSGYKASVLFAQKPMDANGQLAFTRSNDTATRVDENLLIEKVRTNVLLQSNSFDTTWANTNTTETSGQAGYDGTNNAWLLAKSASGGYISQTISVSGVITFSTYMKAGTLNWSRLQIIDGAGNPNVFFDLQNGVIGVSAGANYIRSTITSVGGGWYRCSISASGGSTSVRVYPAEGNNDTSGTSGNILIQNAQLETGDIATDYIATTTAAVSVGPLANIPRIDYLGGGCGKLLLEPQRTNICLWSENFDNATWVKIGTTVTANNAVSPDGYTNADALVENTATSLHDTYQAFVSTSSTAYTFSCYIKPSTRTRAYLRSDTSAGTVRTLFDLTGSGSVVTLNHTSASISLVGNGWYRCSITFTEGTGAAGRLVFVEGAVGTSINYAGNGLTAFWLYGAQLEVGSYASSYVNTLAASVTRGADACSKTGISSLIGQTEGTIYWEGVIDGFPVDNSFFGVEKTASNFVIRFGSTGSGIYAQSYNGSTNLFFETTTYTLGSYVKLAFAYKAGSYAFYKNGTLVASGTNASTIPACDSTMFNTLWGSTSGVGKYSSSQALLFKTRLPNSELASMTTL